jgi:hypothetical protein
MIEVLKEWRRRLPSLDENQWERTAHFEFDFATVLTIHSYLCVALRHLTDSASATRSVALKVVAGMERALLNAGVLNEAEVAELHKVEPDKQ